MSNKLMTLDGLIERLTELRDIAGEDCPIVVGKSFDSKKERMKITLVSLDSSPEKGKQHVAFLVENVPVHPVFICDDTRKKFSSAYNCFEEQNPDWRDGLTDSTYYELAEWYDEFLGIANSESLSDEAYKFADYVWRKLNL